MIRSQFATSKGAIKKIAIVVVYGPDTQRFIHLQSLCGARQRPMHSPDKCVQGVMLPPTFSAISIASSTRMASRLTLQT